MRKTYILYFFVALLTTVFISSCLVEPKFSIEPKISIKEFFYDSTTPTTPDSLVVVIKFQDGDGDIGLAAEETTDSLNIFQDLYIMNASGEFDKYIFPANAPTFDGRLPIINRDRKPKPLEGTIRWSKVITPGFKAIISQKTIKFKLKIVDKAGHESNGGAWAESDSLVLPKL